MKQTILLICLLMLAVIAGCAQQPAETQPSTPTTPAEQPQQPPATEQPAAQPPAAEEPAVEQPEAPAEEEPAAEEQEEAAEEPVAEAPKPAAEGVYEVKTGDKITFDGKAVEFVWPTSRSNGIYFTVDGYKSNVQETGKHEIVRGLKVTYVSAANYQNNGTITVKFEKFVLGKDEYLLEQNNKATILNVPFFLDQVNLDTNSKRERASLSFPGMSYDEVIMRAGDTVARGNLSITMEAGYYKAGNQYCIFKIVPK